MSHLKVVWWSVCLCLLVTHSAVGQTNAYGRDFRFSFLQATDPGYQPFIHVTMSLADQSQSGRVTLDIPALGFNETTEMSATGTIAWGFGFPASGMMNLEEGIDNAVVRISSELDIVVHASSYYLNHPRNHGDVILNVKGVVSRAGGSSGNISYRWFASGGTLQNDIVQEVMVDWHDTNADAYLAVVS